jgi:hypothetical protein
MPGPVIIQMWALAIGCGVATLDAVATQQVQCGRTALLENEERNGRVDV